MTSIPNLLDTPFNSGDARLTVARRHPPSPGWRKRAFAAMSSIGSKRHEGAVHAYKRDLFGALRGEVLELGPGTGNNLSYFSRHIQWTGIEPNPFMHGYLRERAARLGISVELVPGTVERINLPTASVDAVVGSLVLCSVDDVPTALAEVQRVLRPGGTFAFVEHVAAAGGTLTARMQKWVGPLQHAMADGCHTHRETWRDILDAGFAQVCIEHFGLPMRLGGPHIAGYATTRS